MTESATTPNDPTNEVFENSSNETVALGPEPLIVQPIDPISQPMRLGPLNERQPGDGGDGHHWTDEPQKNKNRFNRFSRISSLVLLGLASFLFFLYLTFPYGVIKEVVVLQLTDVIQKSAPVQIRIGTLSPHWFTGIKLNNVVVSNINDKSVQLKLEEVIVRVNVLPFLIGNMSVSASVEQGAGRIDAYIKSSIAGLIQGALPKEVNVVLKNFALEPLFSHALAYLNSSRDPNLLLLQPIVSKTTAGGMLSGTVLFESSDRMKGRINLDAKNAFLLIDDETLKIPKQEFSVFKLDVQYQNGSLNIGEATKFQAPDIGIGLNGTVTLPETPAASAQANLNLALSMHGNVEKSLGMIVPNLLRCKPLTNGELVAKLQGPVSQMNCL